MKCMIKYLIKFVKEEQHAKDIAAGKFYMQAAEYYRRNWDKLSKGQVDMTEGAISHHYQIFCNPDFYVFCAYSVDATDIRNDKITINMDVIEDFECCNGYAVIIDFEKLEKRIGLLETEGYAMTGGRAVYGRIDLWETLKLLSTGGCSSLFRKPILFKRQKEYRFIVQRHAETIIKEWERDGIMFRSKEYIPKVFSLPADAPKDYIHSIQNISSLKTFNNNYIIDLRCSH